LSGIRAFSSDQEATELKTLSEFMIDVALLTDADLTKDEDKNKVTLMTIHSSKGLEFKHVYLVGLEENLFPSQMVLHSRSELEEERRLFYVAITRAEQTCTISYAVSRFVFGNLQSSEPSRFISEISKEFITYENPYGERSGGRSLNARPGMNEKPYIGGLNRMPPQPSNLRSLSDLGSSKGKGSSALELKVGYNVMHERFGKGKVMKIEGTGDDKKATIFFPKEGSKTLLMKFAKLEVVD
jgi:DNA helicase-2/ATP-dependent DNA helicase PcrA